MAPKDKIVQVVQRFMMDKAAEGRIEKRLRRIFSTGMPDWAFDKNGLQTRGSFLQSRPRSPFSCCLRKRARVETKDDGGDGDDNVNSEEDDGDGETRGKTVADKEKYGEKVESCTKDDEGAGDTSKDSESSCSEESEDEQVDDTQGEEERRMFRQRVRDNQEYQQRMLGRK